MTVTVVSGPLAPPFGPRAIWQAHRAGEVSVHVAPGDAAPDAAVAADRVVIDADTAIAELYHSHWNRLVRLAALLTRDGSVAEEIVQDAFVSLHRRWLSLTDHNAAQAYLRTSVVNGARSALRHRGVEERHRQPGPPEPAGPEEHAVRATEDAHVLSALRTLSKRQQEVLVLRYYGDYSEQDIATTLGLSKGAVKSHAHRALAALRQALATAHSGGGDPLNLLGRHPIEDEATANLLRGALTREAERVRPSADGLARILAAAALEAPDADPITGVTRPLPTRARPEPSPAASGPDDVPFPGTPLLSTDLSAELAAPSGPGAEPGVVTLDSRRRGAPRWLPTLAAAAAMVLLAGGLGIFQWGLGKEGNLAEIAGNAAGQNGQSRPAPAAEPLPVYLLERQNGRWALVREFTPTTLTVPADRLEVALELAVKGSGTDPDHLSAWSARGLVGEMTAKITDDSITITVSQELLGGSDPAGAELPPAALAVQQLVWTATAAAGSSLPVWIEGPDAASQLLGSIPLGRDFTRASGPQDPRAPVWISSLRDGEAMSTGTITVRGDALATVSGAVRWSLNDPAGTTVQSGTAPLAREDGAPAQVGERGLWQVPVPLTTPGRFQVRVSQPWPDQPATAPGWTDTKTVVVT